MFSNWPFIKLYSVGLQCRPESDTPLGLGVWICFFVRCNRTISQTFYFCSLFETLNRWRAQVWKVARWKLEGPSVVEHDCLGPRERQRRVCFGRRSRDVDIHISTPEKHACTSCYVADSSRCLQSNWSVPYHFSTFIAMPALHCQRTLALRRCHRYSSAGYDLLFI